MLIKDLITASPNSGAVIANCFFAATLSAVVAASRYLVSCAPYVFQNAATCGRANTSATLFPPTTTSNE